MTKNVFADKLSEPLNGARTAKFYINTGDGNLAIDRLTSGEPVLANGTLQYLETQGLPTRTLIMSDGEATLTLKGAVPDNRGSVFPGLPVTEPPIGRFT